MIHLKNFNEAYQHYQQQKISLRVLQEHVAVIYTAHWLKLIATKL